jgi:hypothetical protein
MTAEDDRGMVGSTMSATAAQLEQLGTYEPGEALIFYEGLQLPFRGKMAQWGDGKLDTVPQESSALTLLMFENDEYRHAMQRTVNGLVLKLYVTTLESIDESLDTLSRKAENLDGALKEIEEDAGKTDYTGTLSDIKDVYAECCADMVSCREKIFDLGDSVMKLRTRFPQFGGSFSKIAGIQIAKYQKYNTLAVIFEEMCERIEKIEKVTENETFSN